MSRKRQHGRGSNKASFADIQREVAKEVGTPVQQRLTQSSYPGGYDPKSLNPAGAGYAVSQPGTSQPQYPPMPEISETRPPLMEMGAAGTAIFAGIITSEEYNPDLFWTSAVRLYEQMVRNDAQIFASLLLCELPIRGAEWKIEPGSEDPQDLEIASDVETKLFHKVSQPWDDILREALTMYRFGFHVYEKIFDVDEDGSVYWKHFAPRLQRTIWRWWIDPDNELRGVQQWTFKNYSYVYLDIPVEKLLIFTNRREGNDYQGISLLRSVYKAWWYKEAALRVAGIGFEREHVGVPVITLPPNHTPDMEQRAASIGKNLRSNESSWVSLINGMTIEWLKSQGGQSRRGEGLLDFIAYLDVQIARNILAPFLNLGSSETGSYALSSDQSQIFLMSRQADAKYLESVFSMGAIPQLVQYNYRNPELFPKLVCRKIQAFDFESVSTALSNLAHNGIITPTPELEDYVADMLGYPKPPRSVVESTKGQQDGPQEPEPNSTKSAPDQLAADIPSIYKTQARLSMGRLQAKIYDRMAREAGRPVITLRESMAFKQQVLNADRTLNRKEPDDVLHKQRAAQFTRRLQQNFRTLQVRLRKAVEDRDRAEQPA